MKFFKKMSISLFTLCALVGTMMPAMAAVGEKGISLPYEEQMTTVYSGPNVGANIDCFSRVVDHISYIEFVNRYMESDIGIFQSDKTISISGRKVIFSGTIQLVREKDNVYEVHYY